MLMVAILIVSYVKFFRTCMNLNGLFYVIDVLNQLRTCYPYLILLLFHLKPMIYLYHGSAKCEKTS